MRLKDMMDATTKPKLYAYYWSTETGMPVQLGAVIVAASREMADDTVRKFQLEGLSSNDVETIQTLWWLLDNADGAQQLGFQCQEFDAQLGQAILQSAAPTVEDQREQRSRAAQAARPPAAGP